MIGLDEEETAVRFDKVSEERAATASELVASRLVAGLVSASAGSGHGNCMAAAAAAATAPRAASDDEFGGGTPKAAADELGG
jgi:hypothetical protein